MSAQIENWRSWWNLLVVLPWAFGLILSIHDWKINREIAQREQVTRGTITTHEPSNHNRYGYVFSVGGKSYTGWESPRRNEFEISKEVRVYFDPNDPAKNALTEFNDRSIQSLGPVPLLMIGIGGVALVILLRRRKNPASV
jgi:hypothetical protein